jgi:hypothetical protein
LGEGMVVAIPDADPTSNSNFAWQLVFNNVGSERWHWATRTGVAFSSPNESYWNFLIPGVGAAPVTAFQVLITMFVFAIGPFNFYVLRRWQKLNLLLVTVPASAAVVTLMLLAYAVFSDGFGVRVRTRSMTQLDQKTGEAVCLGRTTYYAGLTPAKGLSFTGDTTVYPLTESPTNSFDSGLTRRMAWTFDGDQDRTGIQSLESGWLQSRIQTQIVTVRARKTNAKLDIAEQGDRATSIKNQLGTQLLLLVLRDKNGDYSMTRDVTPDSSSPLTPLADGNSVQELVDIRREHLLRAPDGTQSGPSHAIFNIRRRYYYRPAMQVQVSSAPDNSLLERSLQRATDAAASRQMERGSYVAVVERSPEFQLGLTSATDESSLHVINGRW